MQPGRRPRFAASLLVWRDEFEVIMPWGSGPQRQAEKIRPWETGIKVPHPQDIPDSCISTWVPTHPGIKGNTEYGLKFLGWACQCHHCRKGKKIINGKMGR
jgi:hypothetical protein